ncbi:MAG: hypothetical protein V4722_22365 [Bacteroidota bacterium]
MISAKRFLLLPAILIAYSISNLSAQTTWTGSVSNAWNTAGNWSAGVPDAADEVTIPNTANDPVISVAGALAKSVRVWNAGMLTISASGTLTINGAVEQGFLNQGTVHNSGAINIGNTSAVGAYGILNEATFNNYSGAQISINRSATTALYILTVLAIFANAGTVNIGTAASAGGYGVVINNGGLNNNSGGQINIDRVSTYAVNTSGGTLNNAGTIDIGALAGGNTIAFGIVFAGAFNNNTGGQINIDRVNTGIYAFLGTFANAGTVTIGELIGVVDYLVGDQGSGTFSNNAGGVFKGKGTVLSARFTNAGGTLAPGYSPGTLTFNPSTNFASSIMLMEVNGTGTAGINYDRVNVSGTATLGGTLAVSINYTPTSGDQVTIVSATAISGTFSTVTGLPANWNVNYSAVGVTLSYSTQTNTWTGAVSNNWNTAGNWSAGVPDATDEVVIPNVTNDPVISVAGALAKSVEIRSGSLLTISAAGSLNINGAITQGLLNQGTVQNNGIIHIGSVSAVGTYGVRNEAAFYNNSGAQININRSTVTAFYSTTVNAIFTNAGTVNIGAIASSGQNGVNINNGAFNNNAVGQINIDRITIYALDTDIGDVNNAGTINIGSQAGGNTIAYGIVYGSTFNNNTGGQININRVAQGIYPFFGTLANAGTVTIGALTSVVNLFSNQGTGIFSNNTGGVFKGTGNVVSANFTNAGGTLAPGYSPGKLSFDASENFANNIMSMEVNGTGTAGVNYDQVVVTGTATLGGTLALSINFAGAQSNQVTLVSATSISGTFTTVTGLLPGWKLSYTATSVLLTYDLNTTWTGTVSTAWNTAANWTNGVPTASSIVSIPNVTNDPIISVAGAAAYSVNLQPGASLTVKTTGSLRIYGD